jgi:hypothetical protein
MKYGGLDHVSWAQYRAAKCDREVITGDIEVLEDLGYAMTPETLARHAEAAAEVARLLGVDMRTQREKARADAHLFYTREFGLSAVPGGLDAQQQAALAASWVR